MITEDYVSFETAKLLKEKGFMEGAIVKFFASGYDSKGRILNIRDTELKDYPRPTIQMAMKWLREVHKLHIIAEPCLGEGNEPNLSFNRWFWTILKEEGEYKPIRKIDEFPTYEAACENAIKCSLENLI